MKIDEFLEHSQSSQKIIQKDEKCTVLVLKIEDGVRFSKKDSRIRVRHDACWLRFGL